MLQKNPGLARTTSPGIQEPAADGSTKAPKKRTKSGCLTCRKRRIKCGEEKPNCKNCSKTKRVCEQPTVPTTLPRSRPNRPGQFIGDVRLSLQQQSLQPGLPDADDDDFLARYNSRQSQPRSYSNPRSTGSGNSPTLGQFSVHDLHHTSAAREDSSRGQFEPPEHTLDHRYLAADFTGDLHQSQTATNFAPGLSSASSPGPSVRYGQDFIDHDSIYAQSQLAQDVFPLDRVQDSASPLYKHDSSVPEPLPSFTHTSQEQGTVRNAEGFGSAGLQDYEFSGGVEGRLTPLQAHYIQHFIRNVNLNFTAIVEVPTGPSDPPRIQPSNFWSFVIPSMAMKSEPLFHAVMAISALHEANMLNKPEHTALMDYHVAIKKLGGALLESGAFERDDLLATCLILAYFETMHGEMVKWGRHLQGACDIVRRRITNQYTINQDGRYKFTINPTTSDHLIWFHIHQDTIQAILSGNGLFLGLEYIEMCPVRGEPGSVTHRSDQLRVFLARIGDFACKDRRRKEEAAEDDNALISATVRWDTLMSTLTGWRTQLTEDFTSSPVRHATTPFGAVLVFAHPAIASCQIMSLAALIYLHRSHPLYSRVPAEAVKASAASTYLIGQDIIRILSGIMVEGVNNKGIDNGSHVKAMINAVLPVLLAGVAIGGEERRDYVDRLVQDVYTFTGWRTAVRVLQAFDVAWQRPPRDFGMPSLEEDPALEHESEPGSTAASYVPMDKFEVLNTAAGVLGRIKLVSDRYLQPRSSDAPGLAWTGETGQFGALYLQDGGALPDAPRLEYASLSGATVPDYRAGYVEPIAQHSQGPWPPAGHGQRPYELDLDGGLGGWTGTGNRM